MKDKSLSTSIFESLRESVDTDKFLLQDIHDIEDEAHEVEQSDIKKALRLAQNALSLADANDLVVDRLESSLIPRLAKYVESLKDKVKDTDSLDESTEDYWDAKTILRNGFKALLKFNFGADSNGNNYIITNDANEVKRFHADSDEEAKKIFMGGSLDESTEGTSVKDKLISGDDVYFRTSDGTALMAHYADDYPQPEEYDEGYKTELGGSEEALNKAQQAADSGDVWEFVVVDEEGNPTSKVYGYAYGQDDLDNYLKDLREVKIKRTLEESEPVKPVKPVKPVESVEPTNEGADSISFISKEEYDKLPKDYKGTVKELKTTNPDAYKSMLNSGYTDNDVVVLELSKDGTVLTPKRLKEEATVKINDTTPDYDYKIVDVTVLEPTSDGDVSSPDMKTLLSMADQELTESYNNWGRINILSSKTLDESSNALFELRLNESVRLMSFVIKGNSPLKEFCVYNTDGKCLFTKKTTAPVKVIKEFLEQFIDGETALKESESKKDIKNVVEDFLKVSMSNSLLPSIYEMIKSDINKFNKNKKYANTGDYFGPTMYKKIRSEIDGFVSSLPTTSISGDTSTYRIDNGVLIYGNKAEGINLKDFDSIISALFGDEWVDSSVKSDKEIDKLKEDESPKGKYQYVIGVSNKELKDFVNDNDDFDLYVADIYTNPDDLVDGSKIGLKLTPFKRLAKTYNSKEEANIDAGEIGSKSDYGTVAVVLKESSSTNNRKSVESNGHIAEYYPTLKDAKEASRAYVENGYKTKIKKHGDEFELWVTKSAISDMRESYNLKNKCLVETTGKELEKRKSDLRTRKRQALKDAGDKDYENLARDLSKILPKDVYDSFEKEEDELDCIDMLHSILTYGGSFDVDELLKNGYSAVSVFYVSLFVSLFCFFLRLFIVRKLIRFSMKQYLQDVVLRCILCGGLTLIAPLWLFYQLDNNFVDFLFVLFTCLISCLVFIWIIGLQKDEKKQLLLFIKKIIRK